MLRKLYRKYERETNLLQMTADYRWDLTMLNGKIEYHK